MEQYDGSTHCCGSGSTAGTMSNPYPSIAWCYWCKTWVEADQKGVFVIHPRSAPESIFTEEVIPVSTYDPGFCSGCGKPLDAASANNGYCPRCYQSMQQHWDNSPVTAALVWLGRQFKRLVTRQRKLVK